MMGRKEAPGYHLHTEEFSIEAQHIDNTIAKRRSDNHMNPCSFKDGFRQR